MRVQNENKAIRHKPRARTGAPAAGFLLILLILFFGATGGLGARGADEKKDADLDEIGKAWLSAPVDEETRAGSGDREASGSRSSDDTTAERLSRGNAGASGAATPEAPASRSATGDETGRAFFAPEREEGPSFVSVVFRFILFMGLLVGGLYAFLLYVRRKQGVVTGGGGPVEVLVSTPLMPGRYLQIVDVAGKLLVLGVSDQGVRLIQSLDDGPSADKIRLWQSTRPRGTGEQGLLDRLTEVLRGVELRFWATERRRDPHGTTFRAELRQAVSPGYAGEESDDAEALADLLRKQKKRIGKMKKSGGRNLTPSEDEDA